RSLGIRLTKFRIEVFRLMLRGKMPTLVLRSAVCCPRRGTSWSAVIRAIPGHGSDACRYPCPDPVNRRDNFSISFSGESPKWQRAVVSTGIRQERNAVGSSGGWSRIFLFQPAVRYSLQNVLSLFWLNTRPDVLGMGRWLPVL